MIEAVVIGDDPVECGVTCQQGVQRVDVRLPRQHRFDGLLRVFVGVEVRQGEGLETFGSQGIEPMPGQPPTGKRDMTALLAQHPRQRQATGNVATADGRRSVSADQHFHCSSPPALSAA
jgi:hypothetical protein